MEKRSEWLSFRKQRTSFCNLVSRDTGDVCDVSHRQFLALDSDNPDRDLLRECRGYLSVENDNKPYGNLIVVSCPKSRRLI